MAIQSSSVYIQPPATHYQASDRVAADEAYSTPPQNWFSRHKVLAVALAVIVFVAMITAATLAGKSASDVRTVGTSASIGQAAAGIGAAVGDGEFETRTNS